MRSSLAVGLICFGVIFAGLGAIILTIELIGAANGTQYQMGGLLPAGLLVAGAISAAVGFLRYGSRPGPTSIG